MVLGLSIQTFTLIHVIISLLAIASGIVVLVGMFRSNRMPGWTALLPADHHPDQRYRVSVSDTRLHAGHRHWHYFNGIAWSGGLRAVFKASSGRLAMDLRLHSCGSTLPQCIRVDCAIIPENSALNPLAPTQSEPPFVIAQVIRAICFCGVRHDRGSEISSGRDFQPVDRRRADPAGGYLKMAEAAVNGGFSQWRSFGAYLSCVETLSNFALRVEPIALTVAIITTEMPAAIRPYSIAVAPDSSFKNAKTLDIGHPPCG